MSQLSLLPGASSVELFDFGPNTIRVVNNNGSPWFAVRDVLNALGIAQSSTMAVKKIDPSDLSTSDVPIGRGRRATLVSERGLYKLIMRSDKPEALAFQDWVTGTVLPAIRKDGGYIHGEEKVSTGEMSEDELVLKAMGVMQRKIERLSAENKTLSDQVNFIPIDTFRTMRGLYWDKGFGSSLGRRASKLAREQGIELRQEERELIRAGKLIVTTINVYPRHILEQAFEAIASKLRPLTVG